MIRWAQVVPPRVYVRWRSRPKKSLSWQIRAEAITVGEVNTMTDGEALALLDW